MFIAVLPSTRPQNPEEHKLLQILVIMHLTSKRKLVWEQIMGLEIIAEK
jgi:hypothetical protein